MGCIAEWGFCCKKVNKLFNESRKRKKGNFASVSIAHILVLKSAVQQVRRNSCLLKWLCVKIKGTTNKGAILWGVIFPYLTLKIKHKPLSSQISWDSCLCIEGSDMQKHPREGSGSKEDFYCTNVWWKSNTGWQRWYVNFLNTLGTIF